MTDKHAYPAHRLLTCDGEGLGVVEDAVVVIEGAHVVYAGPRSQGPEAHHTHPTVPLLTPGLVDAHTHACWVGSRHGEYVVRLGGGDYEAIAAAGGGILSTQRAVATASDRDLQEALSARLRRMARMGVTTVEVKSGYGLEPEHERRQLRAIAATARLPGVPAVVPTFLALHALPPAWKTRREAYVAQAADLVREVAGAGGGPRLAHFVDAYVDRNAFTPDEARVVAVAAKAAGLGVRLHVGQFADVGGAELAAELGALSVDHVEHVSERGAALLATARTAAVLLPVASFTLVQAPPPVALLRTSGVTLVVASDANPGTAPTESLPLAMAFAARHYGLTLEEVILGVTRNAARSLGLGGDGGGALRGVLRPGAQADLVAWDLPHEACLLQPWGTARASTVLRDGRPLI